jgi:hypothetical protein
LAAHAPHASDEAAHPGGEGPAAQQHSIRAVVAANPSAPAAAGGEGEEPEWESAPWVSGRDWGEGIRIQAAFGCPCPDDGWSEWTPRGTSLCPSDGGSYG